MEPIRYPRGKKSRWLRGWLKAFVQPRYRHIVCYSPWFQLLQIFMYLFALMCEIEEIDLLLQSLLYWQWFWYQAFSFCSGNPVRQCGTERLLEMIKTTCTVERKKRGRLEIFAGACRCGWYRTSGSRGYGTCGYANTAVQDLFISQAALTGESDPLEKIGVPDKKNHDTLTEYSNLAFMGSNVISGSATGLW